MMGNNIYWAVALMDNKNHQARLGRQDLAVGYTFDKSVLVCHYWTTSAPKPMSERLD
jgi:hypothetical protein